MKTIPDQSSPVISTDVVCPDDTNPMHMLKGGRLLHWMDNTAAVCAQMFAGRICVTAGIQDVRFLRPAGIGDMLTVRAVVTQVFNTSMSVSVEATALRVGEKDPRLISTGIFSFVSIGSDGRPLPLAHADPVKEGATA